MRSMFLLPNDQLMTISQNSLIIWTIKDLQPIFETTDIRGIDKKVIEGRLYSLENNKIIIYE